MPNVEDQLREFLRELDQLISEWVVDGGVSPHGLVGSVMSYSVLWAKRLGYDLDFVMEEARRVFAESGEFGGLPTVSQDPNNRAN